MANANTTVMRELDRRRIVAYIDYVGTETVSPESLGFVSDINVAFSVPNESAIPFLKKAVDALNDTKYRIDRDLLGHAAGVDTYRVTVSLI